MNMINVINTQMILLNFVILKNIMKEIFVNKIFVNFAVIM